MPTLSAFTAKINFVCHYPAKKNKKLLISGILYRQL